MWQLIRLDRSTWDEKLRLILCLGGLVSNEYALGDCSCSSGSVWLENKAFVVIE